MKINMERDSFLWSEVRSVLAAVALFLGGVPVVYVLFPIPPLFSLIRTLLLLAWIISGIASVYLLYRWYNGGMKVFGGKSAKDTTAFLIGTVSGINLGVAGLFGINVGMSILSGRLVFVIVGLAYLWSSWHLYERWKANGRQLF
jgi:uncharacterized membrane protein YuzA (DUF378 family)